MHYTGAIEYRFYDKKEFDEFLTMDVGDIEDYILERLEPFNEQHSAPGFYGTFDYYKVLAKDDSPEVPAIFLPQEVIQKDIKCFAFLNHKNQWVDRDIFETARPDEINLFDTYLYNYLNEGITDLARDAKPHRWDAILFLDFHN
jgi:hypothetical protein